MNTLLCIGRGGRGIGYYFADFERRNGRKILNKGRNRVRWWRKGQRGGLTGPDQIEIVQREASVPLTFCWWHKGKMKA